MEVLVQCYSRCVVAIFPERPLSPFALVVFLRSSASDELLALRDTVCACVFDQQVSVIGCDDVIEHAQTEALSRFEEPVEITASITRKPEKKLSLMTAVGDVPNVMRQEVAVGPVASVFLKGAILS